MENVEIDDRVNHYNIKNNEEFIKEPDNMGVDLSKSKSI